MMIDKQELIVIEQLPVITERLKLVSEMIDVEIAEIKAMECTDESVKSIKTKRAELKKDFIFWENRRKQVKEAVISPYEAFNEVYRLHIADKYEKADAELKAEINRVESARKKQKEDEVRAYFTEYLLSKNIDCVTYENAGIRVGLSDSVKSLKEQAKAFVDRVADDLALIETQQHSAEIFLEYKETLNCSQAITTVVMRHRAVEEEKRRRTEIEEKRQTEREDVRQVEEAAPPTTVSALAPPKLVPSDDPIKTVAFKVTAQLSKLKALKKFLEDGGYDYE